MFVFSAIWINSTEIIGGKSIGFFAKNGRLTAVIKIKIKWSVEEIRIFLVNYYLSLYGSEINATFVNPEPDNIPITSSTLP